MWRPAHLTLVVPAGAPAACWTPQTGDGIEPARAESPPGSWHGEFHRPAGLSRGADI